MNPYFSPVRDGWYWVSTKWACGGVEVKEGRVKNTAPIFWRWRGKSSRILKSYEHKRLSDRA